MAKSKRTVRNYPSKSRTLKTPKPMDGLQIGFEEIFENLGWIVLAKVQIKKQNKSLRKKSFRKKSFRKKSFRKKSLRKK